MNRRLPAAAMIVVFLGLASRVYRQRVEARDARRYPPPGDLVDIGGRRLHLCRAGEGAPSVVIVPCLGGPGSEWWTVQRGLARYTCVYTYDRAGLGWSDPGPWPRTYPRMADELHQLIVAAEIPSPYLVIGHSTGGIIARQYAARHPEGLAGLVLVDSSHEDQIRRLARFKEQRDRVDLWRRSICCLFTPLGLVRAAQALGLRKQPTNSADIMAETVRSRRADAQEMLNHALAWPGTKPPDLGDLPLSVITAGGADRGDSWPVWRQMQAEHAGLSTRSTHVVIDHVGHHINRDNPDALVDQIREVMKHLPASPSHR